ncbi:jg25431, partial [Pararge aegeria aegeria]
GGARNVSLEGAGNWSHVLRDLSPGATYQLHAFTLLRDKESAAYASFNFTTSECGPVPINHCQPPESPSRKQASLVEEGLRA